MLILLGPPAVVHRLHDAAKIMPAAPIARRRPDAATAENLAQMPTARAADAGMMRADCPVFTAGATADREKKLAITYATPGRRPCRAARGLASQPTAEKRFRGRHNTRRRYYFAAET